MTVATKRCTRTSWKWNSTQLFHLSRRRYAGAIAPSGDSTIQVTGIFTLLGTPHEITIPMLVHLDGAQRDCQGAFRGALCPMGTQESKLHDLESRE